MPVTPRHVDIPGAYVLELVRLTRRWEVQSEVLLAGLGVSESELAAPGTRVPVDTCAAIVNRAIELTREPALPFYFGMQMRLSSHGFLGFAAMTSPTVREALALANRFSATRTTAVGLVSYVEGDTASLVIEERAPLGALREFAVLSLTVGLWQIGQALTGRAIEGHAECSFPPPDYLSRLAMPGRQLLRFSRPANRLVFAASVLDLPLETADPAALQLARAQCERELAAMVDAGFLGRVRSAIADCPAGIGSLAHVAHALHVSTRTLKRKLAERGTTFSAVVDDYRRQRALLLLEDRTLGIPEIAAQLGYSEVSNFTRAFRRWTGTTPAAYRAR